MENKNKSIIKNKVMKKQLLFVAAMFAAVCANAQGTWNCVKDGDLPEDKAAGFLGTEVAAAGVLTQVAQDAIQNAKVYLYDGAKTWNVKNDKATVGEFTASNGITYSNAYIQGGTNGMPGNLQHSTGVSAHVQFAPAVAGTVYVAAKYGKSKPIWFAKVPNQIIENEELDYADMSAYATSVWGNYIKDDGTLGDTATPATNDTYSVLPCAVEPGYTYFFWVSGSKIMLCGLTFEVGGGSGITNITTEAKNVNAPVYNLAGQRVSKDAKGILIQNGKKFIK